MALPEIMQRVINGFKKMPGIGPKTAERLAFYLLRAPRQESRVFADAVMNMKDRISFCKICNDLSEGDLCRICMNEKRDKSVVCVVEEPSDVVTIEKTGDFKGVYHVLLGALSPLDGVGPDDLKIKELMARVTKDLVKEVILATNSDTEGEATSLYLAQIIKPTGVKLSRIAYGIPVGTDLGYMDQATLSRAFQGRQAI